MTQVKIYRVDKVVQAHAKTQSHEFADLKKRHNQIIKSVRFKKAFPTYPENLIVKKGSGRGSYARWNSYRQYSITLGGNRSEAVLLHEITHIIQFTDLRYRANKRGGHGSDFAKAMLDVVSIVLGKTAADELKAAYSILGIKIYQGGKETKVRKTAKTVAVGEKYGLVKTKIVKTSVAEIDGLERIDTGWWKYQGISITRRGRYFYATVGHGTAQLRNLEEAVTFIESNLRFLKEQEQKRVA